MIHFLKNIRVFGKISEKRGAKDFFHFLVGGTHKGSGKLSEGGTNAGGNYGIHHFLPVHVIGQTLTF